CSADDLHDVFVSWNAGPLSGFPEGSAPAAPRTGCQYRDDLHRGGGSGSVPLLIGAAVLMQMGVQGAWGVIPVHLNELAADSARGLIPGFAYQLGILFASPTNNVEFALCQHFGYQWALASFEVVTIVALAVLLWRGAEAHGKSFVNL